MSEGIVIALAGLLAYYVAIPLRRGRSSISDGTDEVEEAHAEKRAKLGALVELEEDRMSGKLSERDFESLSKQYESEAVSALRRLDSLTGRADESDDLETEIARVRSRLRCPSCGAARPPAARCPECGA